MTEVNLIKEIQFHNGLVAIIIPIGTKVLVNLKDKIGCFNGDSFDIFRDEYSVTS